MPAETRAMASRSFKRGLEEIHKQQQQHQQQSAASGTGATLAPAGDENDSTTPTSEADTTRQDDLVHSNEAPLLSRTCPEYDSQYRHMEPQETRNVIKEEEDLDIKKEEDLDIKKEEDLDIKKEEDTDIKMDSIEAWPGPDNNSGPHVQEDSNEDGYMPTSQEVYDGPDTDYEDITDWVGWESDDDMLIPSGPPIPEQVEEGPRCCPSFIAAFAGNGNDNVGSADDMALEDGSNNLMDPTDTYQSPVPWVFAPLPMEHEDIDMCITGPTQPGSSFQGVGDFDF